MGATKLDSVVSVGKFQCSKSTNGCNKSASLYKNYIYNTCQSKKKLRLLPSSANTFFKILFHIYKFLWYIIFLKLSNTRGNTEIRIIILKEKKFLESNYKQQTKKINCPMNKENKSPWLKGYNNNKKKHSKNSNSNSDNIINCNNNNNNNNNNMKLLTMITITVILKITIVLKR